MDHRSAKLADALQRRFEVSDGEVGQRHCVSGPGPALVHTHGRRVGLCLPSASLLDRAVLELGSEQAGPNSRARSGSSAGNSTMDSRTCTGRTISAHEIRAPPPTIRSLRRRHACVGRIEAYAVVSTLRVIASASLALNPSTSRPAFLIFPEIEGARREASPRGAWRVRSCEASSRDVQHDRHSEATFGAVRSAEPSRRCSLSVPRRTRATAGALVFRAQGLGRSWRAEGSSETAIKTR